MNNVSVERNLEAQKEFIKSCGVEHCPENKEVLDVIQVIIDEMKYLTDNKFHFRYDMRRHPDSHRELKRTWIIYCEYKHKDKVDKVAVLLIHLDKRDEYIFEWKNHYEYYLESQEDILKIWHRETELPNGYFINALARVYNEKIGSSIEDKPKIGLINPVDFVQEAEEPEVKRAKKENKKGDN